jgi:hypothetical protein
MRSIRKNIDGRSKGLRDPQKYHWEGMLDKYPEMFVEESSDTIFFA